MSKSKEIQRVLMCPICTHTMTKPIVQCKSGHSMCGTCVTIQNVRKCRECQEPLTTIRNYQLEQLLENMPESFSTPCKFASKGCPYVVPLDDREAHALECKSRTFGCEGHKFCGWPCTWFGDFRDIEKHFIKEHPEHIMEYKGEPNVRIDFTKNSHDLQLISFFNGSQIFWFKTIVDVASERIFWTFQLVGPLKQARNYYFEFEISVGPIRKFKVTEICENDVEMAEELLRQEKGVVMSFAAAKSYRDDRGRLPIKYRIMNVKKRNQLSR